MSHVLSCGSSYDFWVYLYHAGTMPTARSQTKQHLQVDSSNVVSPGFGNKLVIKSVSSGFTFVVCCSNFLSSSSQTTPGSIHSNNRHRKKPRHSPYDKRIVSVSVFSLLTLMCLIFIYIHLYFPLSFHRHHGGGTLALVLKETTILKLTNSSSRYL